MRSVRIIIPYFGEWPEWFSLYLQSCAANPTIDWLFFTDCPLPEHVPANVRFEHTTLADYTQLVSHKLHIRFAPEAAYKLCDIRPALGVIHAEHLVGYDNFAYGDVDLIYGDLRAHYPDALLERLLVSTHARYVSGHLCVVRNTPLGRNLFRFVPYWRQLFENPRYVAFEDRSFTRLFLGVQPLDGWLSKLYRRLNPLHRMSSFEERFTTPLSWIPWTDGTDRHPRTWFWRSGSLTNDLDAERSFPYLHFMNYKSARYLAPIHGTHAAWAGVPEIVQLSDAQARATGFTISERGFLPLGDHT